MLSGDMPNSNHISYPRIIFPFVAFFITTTAKVCCHCSIMAKIRTEKYRTEGKTLLSDYTSTKLFS